MNFANLVYLAVACFVVSFISWSAPSVPQQPRGILLPAKANLTPGQASQVELYAGVVPGTIYKTLGIVHVQSRYNPANEREAAETMQNYAKGLASTVGAKGVVLAQMGGDPTTRLFVLSGKAIK